MRLVGITARAALVLLAATSLLIGSPRTVGAQVPDPDVPDTAAVDPETTTTLADLDTPTGPVREAPLTDSEEASRTIEWVVIGLLVLAFVVLVATALFWRRTRPSRLIAEDVTANAGAQGSTPPPPTVVAPAPVSPAPVGPQPVAPAQEPGPSGPPTPSPTAPGSWTAFASSVGPENDERVPTATAASSSIVDEPTGADPVVVGPARPQPEPEQESEPEAADGSSGIIQPPRPAFESASTGSWASQGWGDGSGAPAEAPVLPEGFAGAPPVAPSWKWDQRDEGAAAVGEGAAEVGDGEAEGGDAAGGNEPNSGST